MMLRWKRNHLPVQQQCVSVVPLAYWSFVSECRSSTALLCAVQENPTNNSRRISQKKKKKNLILSLCSFLCVCVCVGVHVCMSGMSCPGVNPSDTYSRWERWLSVCIRALQIFKKSRGAQIQKVFSSSLRPQTQKNIIPLVILTLKKKHLQAKIRV